LAEPAVAAYHPDAAKRRLNLSVDAKLLVRAKDSGLNLSRLFEESLATKLRQAEAQRWAKDNREAIAAYSARIEHDGLWHKGLTPWY
jgi:antitoxin CcdA